MKNHLVDLNQNFFSMKDLCLLLHKSTSFHKVLEKYIEENALEESIELALSNHEKRNVRIFHYGTKEGKNFGLYIYRKAILDFFSKHQENLISLGVERERIYALLKRIPTVLAEEKIKNPDNLILIGKIASKFTNNPRIVSLLTQYIKKTCLTATYVIPGEGKDTLLEKSMFCYSPSVRGRSAVYLFKNALPYFLEKYQDHLTEKAAQLEEENEFISLRGFLLMLGKNTKEKELFQFIQKHLDETFELTDENQETHRVKLFNIDKHGSCFYVNIHKKGLLPFIKKYQKELVALGFSMADVVANTPDKKDFLKNFKPLPKIIKSLSFSKEVRLNLYQLLKNEIEKENLKDSSTQKHLILNYRKALFIKESFIQQFFKKHKEMLLKAGADKRELENLTGEVPFYKKTDKMITLREFATRLKADYYRFKKLMPLLEKYLETETFLPTSNSKKQEKSFIYCKSQRTFMYVLKNEKAFTSFLKNHKEELILLGFKKEMIEHLSGEKKYPLLSKGFVYINDLKTALHSDNKEFRDYILHHCLNETYLDEGSTKKPMFQFMRGKRIGYGDWALDKKALKQFVLNHAQALNIKQAVQEAVFYDKPIEKKQENHITLTLLTELLGMTTKRANILTNAVKEFFIHDKVIPSSNLKGKPIPVFSYAYTMSGQMTVYADMNCLLNFLKERSMKLQSLGFKKENIEALIEKMRTDPLFVFNKNNRLILKKQQYLQTHPTNRQRGNN